MDSSATDRIYFNTDVLPERDRFPAFCEGMFRHVIGADIVQIGPTPFSGALDIRRAGAVGIAHISITPARMTRRENNVSDGNDAIVIQYWRHGSARLTQDECDNRIQAGDALIIDNAKPASLCAESASQFWSLTIPRHNIAASTPGIARCAGTKLTDNLGFKLLFGYLKKIAAEDLTDWRAAQLVGGHLIDLTAFALGAVANGFTARGWRPRCAAVRRSARDRVPQRRSWSERSRGRGVARRHAPLRSFIARRNRQELHAPCAGAASGKGDRAVS